MSLPLQTVGGILGAAAIAKSAVRQVGQAISFDQILNGPASNGESGSSLADLLSNLTAAIHDRLAAMGLAEIGSTANQLGELNVLSDGQILVNGDHPRAAEIEASLSSDRAISDIVTQIRVSGSPGPWTVDLTIGTRQGNIFK